EVALSSTLREAQFRGWCSSTVGTGRRSSPDRGVRPPRAARVADPESVDAAAWIERRGGYARVADLRREGVRDRDLGALVRSGALRRPRRGVYSTRHPGDPEFRALAIGGRLT